MTTSDFPGSSQPHSVTVVDITDPAAISAGEEFLDLDALPLQSMPLRVRRVIVRLDSAVVVYHSTNLRVRTRTTARAGMLAYTVFGPKASGTANGLPVRPGLMLAVAPDTQVPFVADGGWESIGFLLRPEDVRSHLLARRRDEAWLAPRGVEPLQLGAECVGTLFDWGKRLVETAAQQPGLFDEEPRNRLAAREELLEVLLDTLRVAEGFESTRVDRTSQTHTAIVKLAEEYAMSQTGDRLYVTDLCRVARVSERTLEYAFKEIMGLTPTAYLTRLRLHRVRQALLAAAPGSITVSTAALDWGFWHFGEFSRAYRACFGELPSDTLGRRTRGTPTGV
jgi:AraC-like DNA-binding protein